VASHGPAPHRVGIVADPVALHRHFPDAPALDEAPAIVDPLAEQVQQAVVRRQVVDPPGCSVVGQVVRRGAQHAAVAGRQGQRHQVGILRLAVAQGDVHRLAVQVGDPVAQMQAKT